jgi:hypothetical protein
MSVATPAEIVNEGRNLVIIALVGSSALHIRIFDASGKKVVDKPENEIVGVGGGDGKNKRDSLAALTNLLLDLKKTTGEKFYKKLIQEQGQEIIDTAAFLAGHPLPPAYPKEFAALKKNGVATFPLAPPTEHSTKEQNPFAPYCNVRITRLRVWIPGVNTSDGIVHIKLRHKGPEVIRRLDREPVPFVHDDVDRAFEYNWKKVKWNEVNHHVENPAKVLKRWC